MASPIASTLLSWHSEFTQIRHCIHQNPELGFEEFQTQQLVIEKLTEYGVDTLNTDYANTAVIATINGTLQKDSQTANLLIGLRADMDALPIDELTDLPYRSKNKGKMHACGHDGHTTMLLMAAKYLCLHRQFVGCVVLIFQPAEEGKGGAQKLINQGFLNQFPLSYCFALHNLPGLAAGHFAFKKGSIMASSDRMYIHIQGQGGHAGLPHTTKDPLLVATYIYQGFQSIISRSLNPLDPAVISITHIQGGETTNVIAHQAKMSGTFRTHSNTVRDKIIQEMQEITHHTACAYGMSATLTLGTISHPPTINEDECVERCVAVTRNMLGDDQVDAHCSAMMGSEDFSFYLQTIKGCFGFIGNGLYPNQQTVGLHHPQYDFNDAIIPIGAQYFIELVHSFR